MDVERTARPTPRLDSCLLVGTLLAAMALALLAAPAAAAPESHSTADVFDQYLDQWPGFPDEIGVHGTSRLVRTDRGVSMTLHTTGLTPGNVYTVWWVVVNHPELCTAPFLDYWCSPPDFGNPDLGISLAHAAGHVVRGEKARFGGHLRVGDLSKVVEGDGLTNPRGALVSLVVRDHGPADPAMVDDQMHDMMACNPECSDVQESIHLAPPVSGWAADLALARGSTEKYRDFPRALADGHTGEFGCVPGDLPFHAGATGIHFGDVPATIAGEVDASDPQILLYMPTDDFGYELVGIEWMVTDTGQEPPELFGQRFERFDTSSVPPLMDALGLTPENPHVYFLHAWVFPEFVNVRGTFADSNPNLRCPFSPILAGGDFVFGHGSGPGDVPGSRLHVLLEAGIVDEETGEAAGRLDVYWLDADGGVLQEAHGVADCLEIDGTTATASGQVVKSAGLPADGGFSVTIEDVREDADPEGLMTAGSVALDVAGAELPAPCSPAASPAVEIDNGKLTFGLAGTLPIDQLIGGDDHGPPEGEG